MKAPDCRRLWPQFVKWLIDKMSEDLQSSSDDQSFPPVEARFMGSQMTTCPFCGAPLDLNVRLMKDRHP